MEMLLLTGACGGVGSKLVPALLNLGYEILAVDDLYSGSWDNLENHENLTKLTLDITDESQVYEKLANFNFSYCIHLAAVSSLPECQVNPSRAFQVNFLGTQIIAEYCAKKTDLKQFIFASTSAVYEGLQEEVLTENLKLSPLLVYPLSKYFSELYLNSMFRSRNFPSVILRLFNVFGDRQNMIRKSPPLINYLVRELSNGRSPVLYGWNAPGRDYISVNTVVDIVSKLIGVNDSYGNTYNVCTGKTLTVREIYSIVSETMGCDILPVLEQPKDLWFAYSDLHEGAFPLASKFIEAETNKSALGSPELLLNLIGGHVIESTEVEVSRIVMSIQENLKLHNL